MTEKSKKEFVHPHYRRFYLMEDVESHGMLEDCWVVIHGEILDISRLLIKHKGDPLCKPLVFAAGTDISHWFDKQTGNPKQFIDVERGIRAHYLPQGRYLHVPPDLPGNFNIDFQEPWWKDKQYRIGTLTSKLRKIRIINTLTHHEEILEVPVEESLREIERRYKDINKHSESYTWKDSKGKILDMKKNLHENEIKDEDFEYNYLDVPDADRHIPSVMIYFDDDLTEA